MAKLWQEAGLVCPDGGARAKQTEEIQKLMQLG